MFNSFYKVKIEGKDVKRFIKKIYSNNIFIENIELYDKYAYLILTKENYKKLMKVKTIYEIKIVRLYGIARIIDFLKRYKSFLIILFLGFIYLIFLSNIIFNINVIHSKKEIRNLIKKELKYYDIDKYKFVKSYSYQEKVKNEILEKNRDKIEWLEIERIGSSYVVRVEERIIKTKSKEKEIQNITAKKDGIIMKIQASNGEIVRKKGDFVKKGDVVITGIITKNENIKNVVAAEGTIYAETWYKVNINMPYHYKEEKITNNERYIFKFILFSKDIHIFNFKKYKTYKDDKIIYLKNNILPIGFSFSHEVKTILNEKNYNKNEIVDIAIKNASKKLESSLKDDEKILSYIVLNKKYYDNYVDMNIFYKVYENITDYKKIDNSSKNTLQ